MTLWHYPDVVAVQGGTLRCGGNASHHSEVWYGGKASCYSEVWWQCIVLPGGVAAQGLLMKPWWLKLSNQKYWLCWTQSMKINTLVHFPLKLGSKNLWGSSYLLLLELSITILSDSNCRPHKHKFKFFKHFAVWRSARTRFWTQLCPPAPAGESVLHIVVVSLFEFCVVYHWKCLWPRFNKKDAPLSVVTLTKSRTFPTVMTFAWHAIHKLKAPVELLPQYYGEFVQNWSYE